MTLLLDTHVVIWAATDEAELTPGERNAISAAGVPVVSAVAVWETRLKWNSFHPSGQRKGVIAPEMLLRFVDVIGWTILPLSARHAATQLQVPMAHRDPFDELLLVQAQVEGLRLLTRDSALRGHPLALFA
ncbi:type II toxin-antitoxin system VapC family toxin [Polymorphobacter fuscus]|uniref:type II toxin-antitoxin system VapC family toxin n=1 Tax=Sandarakinorhabdus fusca TaxID=1439888 RepID=UPI001297CFC4|nr:type II toxin-antitoxin system VapC family toxin [Polymorphobacter fuscus]NJC09106.1 PIN domain nuclease of toxin-antitoxin system [Polymorphobacter fuscus]